MHSNVYSCLFLAANIKEENIIDSQVNVVYLTTNKRVQNMCFFFVSDLKIDRRIRLSYNKKFDTKVMGLIPREHNVSHFV